MSLADLDMAEDLALQAERLLDLWSQLALQHVALGTACGCGMGGISLRLQDFELDIVGYLEDAGLRSGIDEVVGFFQALQQAEPRDGPLRGLLEDARRERLPPAVGEWVLPKVERTLRSFAELHGSGRQG